LEEFPIVLVLTFTEGFSAVQADPGRKVIMTNGITNKIRAARRRTLRAIERILNSYGWKTIDGHAQYVGRRSRR
jgi:hypothetical protein